MISVIIPTYNRKEMLKTAIYSVLAQTYSNYEIIVVDDCSSDDTKNLFEEDFKSYVSHGTIKFYQNGMNRDKSYSRNFAVQQSSGQFLTFLDDDDFWFPNHLELLNDCFIANPKIAMAYSNSIIFYSSGKIELAITGLPSGKGKKYQEEFLIGRLSFSNCIMLRKEAFYTAGGFEESLRVYEDRLLYSKIAISNEVYFNNVPTVGFRPGAHSYSFKDGKDAMAFMKEKVCLEVLKEIDLSAQSFAKRVKRSIFYNLSEQFSYCDNVRAFKYLMQAIKEDALFVLNPLFFSQLVFVLRKKGLRVKQFAKVMNNENTTE